MKTSSSVTPPATETPRLGPADLRGILPALVTPFHPDGSLDLASFDGLVDHLLAAGVTGLVLAGTTGEGPTVTWDEAELLLRRLVERVSRAPHRAGRRVPIVVGTGTASTRESCERTARARALGADAVLVVTPYYNRPSAAGVRAHVAAVAEVGLPVIAYHIPYRTGLALGIEDLLSVVSLPGVIGLKESSGGVAMTLALAGRTDRTILCGEDALLLPALASGARGGLLASANLVPRELLVLVAAFEGGQLEEARALSRRLAPLMELLYREPNPAPLKAVLADRGLIATPTLRLPLVGCSAGLAASLAAAMTELTSR